MYDVKSVDLMQAKESEGVLNGWEVFEQWQYRCIILDFVMHLIRYSHSVSRKLSESMNLLWQEILLMLRGVDA